jgi:uncharacterized protein
LPKVIHFEIPADDLERAVNFYRKVFGWIIDKYGGGAMNYWLVTTGDNQEPGINGAIAEKDEIHPSTINTVSVPSFEVAISKIEDACGKVLMPKMAVPGVGYMTYCRDTEGNIFGIMQTDPAAK